MRGIITASLAATLMSPSLASLHTGAQSGGATGQPLKTVSSRDLSAMCLRLTTVRGHLPVTRHQAIQIVESIPVLKRYGKTVLINEAVIARVKAAEPVLRSEHHPVWVLVSHQSTSIELYFVDAVTARLVTYMSVGDGCRQ